MPASPADDPITRAGDGDLPAWTEAIPWRRAHMSRVAALMDEWAAALGLDAGERLRWRATGWLHDTLRNADPESLRPGLGPPFDTLPGRFLHGPAAARRLAADGVADAEVLDAIRYHTLGHADLGRLGLALIAADYLEPGRPAAPLWRTRQRARMPGAFDDVVRNVVRDRLRHALARPAPLRPEMVALWNRLARAQTA